MKGIPADKLIEWALENLKRYYVKVAPSEVHGVGVIAIRDIPKDTAILHFSYQDFPCLDIPKSRLKKELPKEVYSQIIKNWAESEDAVMVPLNVNQQLHYVNFLNHSKDGNVRFQNGAYITKRKIAKGEEIRIDFAEEGYNPHGLRF